ncbi:MAG: hypothetical protein ACYC6Y_02665 [Thermoguttaceae bacterium]
MTIMTEPQMNVWCDGADCVEDEIRVEVRGLIGRIYPGGDFIDRRRERRYPYPYLVRLLPVDADGTVLHCEAVVAVGKHLSDRGIGFYHPKPLPHRLMIVVLESADGTISPFVVDLGWCRFTHQGWYESGGKFVDVLPEVPDFYDGRPA